MSQQDIFDSKIIRQAEQSGPHKSSTLLDELGLPPKLTSYIKKNIKQIQLVGVCFMLLVVAWSVFDYYLENKRSESSTMLTAAMQESDDLLRADLLAAVVDRHSSTDAAIWARLEQSHISERSGDYVKAIAGYETILGDLSTGSPLLPLVRYSVAVACENQGELDKALKYYGDIVQFEGFATQGYASQGRVYEKKGDLVKAIEAYEKAGDIVGPEQALIKNRLKYLQAAAGKVGSETSAN
ncbi:MAG: tetratricopeptide repeat protein [Proteobacteria bacterium]|nr:tetratricopeptide repeat protein [Pseudomonadota bacterium]MBU1715202.1 tetratricopeptide repeat protein [Pseudomonadota bacterium]